MQVEILPPGAAVGDDTPRIADVRAPGWLGAALALLTMTAAFGVGFLALFGRTLLASLLVTLAWPWVFSSQFTAWVFGAERVVFWKILTLFLIVDVIVRLFFRRELWPKK
ncbi:MAG: hypothetical protein WC881_10420 [Elusimicrobiota bacterium]|jgi:hypothetical protein